MKSEKEKKKKKKKKEKEKTLILRRRKLNHLKYEVKFSQPTSKLTWHFIGYNHLNIEFQSYPMII
jgi:hypothetical protein